MSSIKLFSVGGGSVSEIPGAAMAIEKKLQELFERHLEDFLAIRFLASEYSTGKTHAGRIDSLGLDENGCPVIIEYKRFSNQNVINQGLFYLDWLLDHRGEFELLVLKKLGNEAAGSIEWANPRLLCIAADFTRYDEHAVQQINRNIELLRYRCFGDSLLLLELVNAVVETESGESGSGPKKPKSSLNAKYATQVELLEQCDEATAGRFRDLCDRIGGLGDDVQTKQLKYYLAFKRIRNFACIEVRPKMKTILVYLKLDPSLVELEEGFSRDVSNIGHFGTGDLEVTVRSDVDLERAMPFVQRSYDGS